MQAKQSLEPGKHGGFGGPLLLWSPRWQHHFSPQKNAYLVVVFYSQLLPVQFAEYSSSLEDDGLCYEDSSIPSGAGSSFPLNTVTQSCLKRSSGEIM